MLARRLEATIGKDRRLTLENLPFHSGETVEVIILASPKASEPNQYPLRGTVIQYINPTESVDQDDWAATQCSF